MAVAVLGALNYLLLAAFSTISKLTAATVSLAHSAIIAVVGADFSIALGATPTLLAKTFIVDAGSMAVAGVIANHVGTGGPSEAVEAATGAENAISRDTLSSVGAVSGGKADLLHAVLTGSSRIASTFAGLGVANTVDSTTVRAGDTNLTAVLSKVSTVLTEAFAVVANTSTRAVVGAGLRLSQDRSFTSGTSPVLFANAGAVVADTVVGAFQTLGIASAGTLGTIEALEAFKAGALAVDAVTVASAGQGIRILVSAECGNIGRIDHGLESKITVGGESGGALFLRAVSSGELGAARASFVLAHTLSRGE